MRGLQDTVNHMKLHSKFYECVLLYIFLDRGFMTEHCPQKNVCFQFFVFFFLQMRMFFISLFVLIYLYKLTFILVCLGNFK